MSITLVETSSVEPKTEVTFDKDSVLIGRDPDECDIVFERTKYPMVSRRHAELRMSEGGWVVADLNSSYGVYVNGQKINSLHPIVMGNSIQLGMDGPVLLVIWFDEVSRTPQIKDRKKVEVKYDAVLPITPNHGPEFGGDDWGMSFPSLPVNPPEKQTSRQTSDRADVPSAASEPVRSPVPVSPSPAEPKKAFLIFESDPGRPLFEVRGSEISLGRDTSCDVVVDQGAGSVSRLHAKIRLQGGVHFIDDNKSFNGTLVNDARIASPTPLNDGDRIRLGMGGPVLKFSLVSDKNKENPGLSKKRSETDHSKEPAKQNYQNTFAIDREEAARYIPSGGAYDPVLIKTVDFGQRSTLTIGRDDACDVVLDGLQISKRHAKLSRSGSGVSVEDLRSTNGVYVNGSRVTKHLLVPDDQVQIGPWILTVTENALVSIFDSRSRTKIDVVDLSYQVRGRGTSGKLSLLDRVSLSIQPNEFIGLLGPSGAGKSVLIEVMNGMRKPSVGNVRINDLDLHRHLDSLKQFIGYVPQDDIIHRELTVYRTLYYVAKLRLSGDVSSSEIQQIINEVLDVTGLTERRDVRVADLSGGQRKRVSIAVELITKPSVIFLDEPTSGLDPSVEERIMKLFRQIADAGRTVVLTTHAMENVALFDKIVVLMSGKVVFCGKPDEALKYFKASNFKELYARLEEPVGKAISERGGGDRRELAERAAEEWRVKFLNTPQFRENIEKPLKDISAPSASGRERKRRLGIFGSVRQWITLSKRYLQVLLNEKLTLFILFAQAPIIALMTFFVMGSHQPRDFVYFVIALVAIWFGISVSAREIVREKVVYKRERMINLGLMPYLASKLFVLGFIVMIQCLFLFVPLKILDIAGLMAMPGELFGLPQLWAMLLTAGVGIGVGLLVSSLVRSSEMATSLVPLILIPQILFSGLVGVPYGVNRVVSLAMPAAWSFDTMKRFSTLDTLEEEGANPKGKTKGLGLFKYIDSENEKIVAKIRQDFEDYKKLTGSGYQSTPSEAPKVDEILSSASIKKIPDDLSDHVTFLHPWMNDILNQIVLMLMFAISVFATLIILRIKDN